MPSLIKATFVFQSTEHGWTESFFFTQSDSNLFSARAALLPLQAARIGLLALPANLKAVRVSTELDNTGKKVNNEAYLDYVNKGGTFPGSTGAAEYSVALQVIWRDSLSRYKKFVFLRGVPDPLETNGGVYIDSLTGWTTAFNKWSDALTTLKAQWMSLSLSGKPVAVTNYTCDPDSSVVNVTVAADTWTIDDLDSIIKVRFKGINAGTPSRLNGYQLVTVTGLNTCELVKPLAISSFVKAGTMQLYTMIQPTVFKVDGQKIVTRKVGAPLLISRGRRRATSRT